MTDEKTPGLEELGKFAKMVKKQLRKAYNADVGRITKKMDLHNQPKAVLRVGSGDDKFELWFRYASDKSIVVDKIENGAAAGTLKINTPICHLRTSALLSKNFGLPEKVEVAEKPIEESAVKRAMEELVDEVAKITGEDWDKVQEHLMDSPASFIDEYGDRLPENMRKKLESLTIGIREEKEEDDEPAEEPEDFEEELVAPSNKFAIVDASVLESITDNELADQAIIVPIKYPKAVFEVIAEYDDTILRNLTITPSETEENGVNVVRTSEFAVQEGVAPLSHDSSIERKIRKHTSIKQKHHMKHAKDVPGRLKHPSKRVLPKRDQSKKDQRKKQRQAEDIEKKRFMVQTLLEDRCKASELTTDELRFADRVLNRLSGYEAFSDKANAAKTNIKSVLEEKSTAEANELLEAVEWIRKNPIRSKTSQ